jgi:hypothetical protein
MLAALKDEASNTHTNQGTQLQAAESIQLTICQCIPKPLQRMFAKSVSNKTYQVKQPTTIFDTDSEFSVVLGT